MRKQELSKALKMAQSDEALGEVPNIVDGYGLPGFAPVCITLKNLAALIRWQCIYFNGNLDNEALNDIAILGKKRFIIL